MDRFAVTYRLAVGSPGEAEDLAAAIALEDTVEIPRDVVPKGYVEDVVLGRVLGLEQVGDGVWYARIGYHVDAVGRSPQSKM